MNFRERLATFADKPKECWPWPGAVASGYGVTRVGDGTSRGKGVRAHMLAWETLVGPIPDEHTLVHMCGNRRCMNPGHMHLMPSVRVNFARMLDRLAVAAPDKCWPWRHGLTGGQYGRVPLRPGKRGGRSAAFAHRLAYEMTRGPIPDGLHIDHLCRNTVCVNPAHLEPVTPKENSRRSTAGWRNRAKTHCVHGHELSEGNLAPSSLAKGYRQCLMCMRARAKAQRAKRSAERAA